MILMRFVPWVVKFVKKFYVFLVVVMLLIKVNLVLPLCLIVELSVVFLGALVVYIY